MYTGTHVFLIILTISSRAWFDNKTDIVARDGKLLSIFTVVKVRGCYVA
jgi:hypothetical protein